MKWVYLTATMVAMLIFAWFGFMTEGRVPIVGGFDFVIHEAGHVLTVWAPDLWTAAAGSVFQIAFPLMFAGYFAWKRSWFAAAVTLAWAGANCADVAVYVADAPYRALPLHGGDAVVHDWHYILGWNGWLHNAATIARTVRAGGVALLVLGVGAAVYGTVTFDERPIH